MRQPDAAGKTTLLGAQGIEVIRQEASAIRSIADELSSTDLGRAIEMILATEGKVILVGSGKSGIAARKIAATLTSTGTFALFLHPVDALHGDLGAVTKGDIAIVVSTSGASEEIKTLTRHLKERDVSLIAITGAPSSVLARAADVPLIANVSREAGPLGIAPTTSTIAALAVGDAIAAVLMSEKNITLRDFALNHPGGAIGRLLTATVGELMHSGERNPVVIPNATLAEAAAAITRGGLGAVSVITAERRLVGLLTDGDVRRVIATGVNAKDVRPVSVADVMTREPVVVHPTTPAIEALRLMEERASQIAVLPVVDEENGTAIGLIRVHDIVREGFS